MKKELIKTENYLLVVDDSEIKKGDWFYVITKNIYGGNIISQSTGNGEFAWSEHILSKDTDEKGYHPSHCKKATAHLPLNDSPTLEGVTLLPPFEIEDSNKDLFYQKQVMNPYPTGGQSYASYEKGFIDGYNKAREKCIKEIDKQISDFKHDLKESTSTFVKQNCEGAIFGLMRLKESLSQPKTPTHFEFEMEDGFSKNNDEYIDELGAKGNYYTHLKVIKTTTNSQGQKEACGKYIY